MKRDRLDGRWDKYSMGVVMYQMLNGAIPQGRHNDVHVYGSNQGTTHSFSFGSAGFAHPFINHNPGDANAWKGA